MKELLSTISLIVAVFYLYVGFYIYRLNKYSNVCRIFLFLNIAMSIWSFAYSFAYTAVTHSEFYFWNKFSAFGWCSFTALILYLVLTLTENKLLKYWYIKLLVVLPAPVFLFMVLFLFGPNIETSQIIKTFFYTGNFIYNLTYLMVSICLLFLWRKKSKSLNQKKQANVMLLTGSIAFLLNLFMETLLPMFGVLDMPKMGQLYFMIMLSGVYYAISKYQFMMIPTSIINKELFNELVGLTFLVDTKGIILKVNKQVYQLLNYTEKEITGTSITSILDCKKITGVLENCDEIKETLRFKEVLIATKSKELIPFSISITPLFDSKMQTFLGLLIVGQDIRLMKNLQNEILYNKITNDKLKNHEELLRTIIESMPFSIILSSRKDNKILYVNNKTAELFNIKKPEMIGIETSSLYKNPQDRKTLIEDMNQNGSINEIQMVFKRKDGSELLGLITIVPAVYLEQDIVIACISDITQRKRSEEKLKQNSEEIEKMNNELIKMNLILTNRSIRDGLTNLYNHQYINELLEEEISKVTRAKVALCAMMLDIDLFKNVNDTYGHQIGDKVLVVVSNLILENSRSTDLVGRYGGEEFIALLPNIKLTEAYNVAERIRLSIQEYDFGIKDLKVTISIGLTQFHEEDGKSFINRADILLYEAKRNGRNRIEMAYASK